MKAKIIAMILMLMISLTFVNADLLPDVPNGYVDININKLEISNLDKYPDLIFIDFVKPIMQEQSYCIYKTGEKENINSNLNTCNFYGFYKFDKIEHYWTTEENFDINFKYDLHNIKINTEGRQRWEAFLEESNNLHPIIYIDNCGVNCHYDELIYNTLKESKEDVWTEGWSGVYVKDTTKLQNIELEPKIAGFAENNLIIYISTITLKYNDGSEKKINFNAPEKYEGNSVISNIPNSPTPTPEPIPNPEKSFWQKLKDFLFGWI